MSSKITMKQLGHLNSKQLRRLRKRNRKAIQKLGYLPEAYEQK